MNKNLLILGAALLVAPSLTALASGGAPHTLRASANFNNVTLQWKAPADAKTLQWHDGNLYNGDGPNILDQQKAAVIYAGARFTAADLANNVGDVITSVGYGMYYDLVRVTVMVYEDGKLVAQADADRSLYKKNAIQNVPLPAPVTVKAGSEYLFAVRYEGGHNVGFFAIKDRNTNTDGEGDLLSYDGKSWTRTGNGDYIITANLTNDNAGVPASYKVYRDGQPVGDPVNDTSCVLSAEPAGTHSYAVAAVYDGGEELSGSVTATSRDFRGIPAAPAAVAASVSDLDVDLSWNAPLEGASTLSWAQGDATTGIGGTASSNAKVWVRHSFSPEDLNEFAGATLTALNLHLQEATVTGLTLWIMEDGALVYSQAVAADDVKAAKAGEWNKFALTTPFTLKDGHRYDFGFYALHTAKTHPMSVCGVTTDNKGNFFSTSSCNSSNFLKSSPSWKTLSSGNIAGNFMISADVQGVEATSGTFTYDVVRDGQTIASGIPGTDFADAVPAPGKYSYTVTAIKNGKASAPAAKAVKVALPAAYAAPVLTGANVKDNTVSLAWSADHYLSHAGEPAYYITLDEEMDLMWGQQFTKAELEPYAGMAVKKISFIVGDNVTGDLKIGFYTTTGTALYEYTIAGANIQPLAQYTLTLDKPFIIDATQDLVLAYSATSAANTHLMVIDEGPLKTGGARISLTGGARWLNLSTINSTYNDYNICIGAFVGNADSQNPASVDLKAAPLDAPVSGIIADGTVCREFGAEAARAIPAAPARAAKLPNAVSYNVYRNGEFVLNTPETTFSEKLPGFNSYDYRLSAVYENGWESPLTDPYTVTATIAQRPVAPFALTGTPANGDLALSWKAPGEGVRMTYVLDETSMGHVGITSTNPTTYAIIRFTKDDLKPYVGHKFSHIRFALYNEPVTSLSVVVSDGENIIYTQAVDVTKLVYNDEGATQIAVNDVLLNAPVEIYEGAEMGVGYVCKYAKGARPLGLASNAAVAGYSDIISQSASNGTWYSLKTKYNVDNSWYLSTYLTAPDQEIKTQADAAVTYNVYCDGLKVAEGVSANAYTVSKAANGRYTVTAVDAAGNETAESNAVLYNVPSGVDDITVDAADTDVRYYDLQGRRVLNPERGLYLRRSAAGTEKAVIR